MGEPMIIWPPGCGNFTPGDGSACLTEGGLDCTQLAVSYGAESYEQQSEGFVMCCPH